jgi:C-terminal peptidase prc
MGPKAYAQQPDPTPAPSLPPPPQAAIRTAPNGSTYPQNLLISIEAIEESYVRPVKRVDLLVAALSGLYEASGEPAPTTLRADAEKAVSAKEAFRLMGFPAKLPDSVRPRKDDEAVLRLLERTRKQPEIARRLNDEEALLASCRAMLRILDPHCEILIGDDARRANGRMDNFGVGIDLEENGGPDGIRIKDVLPGSPAQRAGLRPQDRITAVNGRKLLNVQAFQAMRLLNPPESTTPDLDIPIVSASNNSSKVRVTIERAGTVKPRDITMERGSFHAETVFGVQRRDDNTWYYWIDRDKKLAQIRLGFLRGETTDDLREVLTKLREGGMRGLLLDLRGCPGGFLGQSVKVSGLFLDKCRIYSTQGRGAECTEDQDNKEIGPFRDLPITVLVNGETSGGGELIAAALQDHKRALIAGQRTRGKASIQIIRALPARGTSWKLTSALLVRPSGKNLNRFPDSKPSDDWGVRPNDGLEFRVSPAMNQQVREWWIAQTLRPGSSRERLPLDDPANDPQRQLALQALRERLR